MDNQYGAHELEEVSKVLNDTINGINLLVQNKQHARSPLLRSMIDRLTSFMLQERNTIAQALNSKGMASSVASYHFPKSPEPIYGLQNGQLELPMVGNHQFEDRDVCSAMLDYFKVASNQKMGATLECADRNLRSMMQQSAINSSEMAYEVWKYMNHHGWHPIATLAEQPIDLTAHNVQADYAQGSPIQPNTIM